jgi:hypothetical protein
MKQDADRLYSCSRVQTHRLPTLQKRSDAWTYQQRNRPRNSQYVPCSYYSSPFQPVSKLSPPVRTQFFDEIFVPASMLPEGSALYVALPFLPPFFQPTNKHTSPVLAMNKTGSGTHRKKPSSTTTTKKPCASASRPSTGTIKPRSVLPSRKKSSAALESEEGTGGRRAPIRLRRRWKIRAWDRVCGGMGRMRKILPWSGMSEYIGMAR